MIRILTAGESHGPALTGIVEGLPAGLAITADHIDAELRRRQRGAGAGGRMGIECDRIKITAGVLAGATTGAPVALQLDNLDFANWQGNIPPFTVPRPGHADLTGAVKYGYRDLRLALERASARETAMRVALGAICRRLLAEFAIEIGGYVLQIGPATASIPSGMDFGERFVAAEKSEVRCPDPESSRQMQEEIARAATLGDTLGGVIEIVAVGVPPGLGSYAHYDRRLGARIAAAMMSIPAIKGVEIGPAFAGAGKYGSEVHDPIEISPDLDTLRRPSDNAGGIEGGISTGGPIVVRLAKKPISTVLKGMPSVDLATGKPQLTRYERSDVCAVPRAVPVGEAMMAIAIADALVEKLGGDSMEEMRPRFEALRRCRLTDLPMKGVEWNFGYSSP